MRRALLSLVAAVAACTSPEASRTRGGGPGADVRNRDPIVEMHGGSKMYHETPCLLPDEKCPSPPPASGLPGDFPDPPRRGAEGAK